MKKEIEIPEGYEARIEDNKVIIEQKESEDERIRKSLVEYFRKFNPKNMWDEAFSFGDVLSYLEKQKEKIVIKQNIIDSIRANTQPDWDFSTIPNLREEINRFFGKKFVLPHTEDTIITVSDVIRCAYHFYKFGQQEQKPAEWSLTDATFIEEIDETLFMAETGRNEVVKNQIERERNWLNSIPERFNLQPKQEWSEEDKVMLNNIIWSVHMKSIIKPLYEMDDRSRYKKYEDFLKALPERFNLQPRTEWSEEDKQKLNRIYEILGYAADDKGFLTSKRIIGDKEAIELQDFLKSLTERFNLQPKQEWSEEEMKVLDSIIDDYEKANKSFCGYDGKIAFLKAIRDGEYDLPKQEWSEEDEKRLKSIIHRIEVQFACNIFGEGKLDVDWLKSLRPQPHWKPSEEKMVALDAAISYLEESDNEDYEILNSLYEDLKKL